MQICKSRLVAFVLCCLLAGSAQAAGTISLSQKLDRTDLAFEDSVTLELTLTWTGPQYAYRFDRPLQPRLEKFQIGPFSTAIGSSGSGADEITTRTFTYTLIPIGSGAARIEPVTIAYVSYPDSIPGELVSEPITVQIAAPIPVIVEESHVTWWLFSGVLIGAAALAAVVILRMRRSPMSGKNLLTPAERFMDNMNRLKNEAGSDLKKFQTGLFGALSLYLGEEYNLALSNKNSAQIAAALKATSIPDSRKERILGWLDRAEREKYSPAAGAPGETIRLATEVQQYFEEQVINIMRRKNAD
jgi:hypothetical protein